MTKRLKIILITLGSLLLLGGVGIWYAASAVDPVKLTKLLATSVKVATGRDLKIVGPVNLSFFPRISVSAERLSLSNASWADAPEMLTLKRVELDIKFLPLLSKQVEIASVKLAGLELFLQKNTASKVNWDMSSATSTAAGSTSNDSATTSSSVDGLISIENIAVLDAQIQYQDAFSSISSYEIKRLALREGSGNTTISLDMKTQGQVLELSGKTGSFSRLFQQWDVSPSQFPLDLSLTLNGKLMLIKGELDKQPKASPTINLALTSKAFDWPSLGKSTTAPRSINTAKSESPTVHPVSKPQSTYLFSSEAIGFNALPQAKGKITVNIVELGLPNRKPIENLQATLQLDGNVIDIPQLTLQMGKGSADIQIHLSQLNSPSPVISVRGVTKDFTLENLSARVDPSSKVSGGDMKLAFNLNSSGGSLHQIAGNSSGKIQISVSQAKMGSNFLNDAGDFVITLLNSMNPLRKKSTETILECAVAYLPINQGQINIANTVGIETDRLNAVLAGSINLKTEAVNLTVNPQEKSGITTGLDLAGLVKMGGTLMNPKAAVNQTGVVNSAVSIGLGFLTGGASILAENARSMTTKTHPCRDALHSWSDIYPGVQ
ncbi:AsmA family protein [Polynucleobacter arcticus]|uniref:AsmA domain-containing protein n=1 Tax=Polynucleobacter arcticus TaxID=1743165 RepID=A0A6M9PDA0_9BURK|nr:AsmA family protein [Polynucleobacter arcticus]QKM59954.1 hypothetical protein DN92_02250 [Polynucleobacter arcticus]